MQATFKPQDSAESFQKWGAGSKPIYHPKSSTSRDSILDMPIPTLKEAKSWRDVHVTLASECRDQDPKLLKGNGAPCEKLNKVSICDARLNHLIFALPPDHCQLDLQ